MTERSNGTYSARFCDERHHNIDMEFKGVKNKMKDTDSKIDKMDTKLFWILLTGLGNIVAILGIAAVLLGD